MAVYTKLSDNEIKLMVQQGYGLQVLEVNPVAEGIENSIYKLKSVSGDSYAYVIFEEVPIPLVESYCMLFEQVSHRLQHATIDSVVVPAGLALNTPQEGRRFAGVVRGEGSQQEKAVVLQPWIQGSAVKSSEILCLQLGQFLGVVNSMRPEMAAGPNIATQQIWAGLPVNQHLLRIQKVETELAGLDSSVQDQFWAFKASVAPVVEAHARFEYGLVHGDLFSDNALAVGDALTAVIDFFNASWSPLLLDVAICLMDWCYHDERFHEAKTRALLQGFRQKCEQLPSFDLEYWPELVRLAAFRFWCTRQEYYLACQKRGVAPVQGRDPAFCAQVFDQVSKQEGFLRSVFA